MPTFNPVSKVAVIGAGVAGASCAAGLRAAGLHVTVFDKSRGVGGRMATRRAAWADSWGGVQSATFDHGAPHFSANHARFRARLARAEAAGCVASWQPRVHSRWPGARGLGVFVAVPSMPSLCRHWLADTPLHLEHPVQRLQRDAAGWQLVLANGNTVGPFDLAVLALPAAQSALLLAGHHDEWADEMAAVPMQPCWTLMAVTDDVDWPWDAAEPDTGPLVWVARNDRQPGREARPGLAGWTAHAGAAWSAAHLEAEPSAVAEALRQALQHLLPSGAAVRWHHSSVHRWRYAALASADALGGECRWDARLRLGVCGDAFGGSTVEAAWRSGDELADTVAAWSEAGSETAATGLAETSLDSISAPLSTA